MVSTRSAESGPGPGGGCEVHELVARVVHEVAEDIGHVGPRVDEAETAAPDDGEEHRSGPRAALDPGEQPVLSADDRVAEVPRRLLLARRPDLVRGVLGAALRVLFRWYAVRVRAPRQARCGAVTIVQRFGSALNLNVHFHVLFPDGAWVPGPGPAPPTFRSVQGPSTDDVEDLVVRIADACERYLGRRGYGEGDLADDDADPDDAQALLQQASLAGVAALGRRAGRQARRLQVHGGHAYPLPPRCAGCDGYNPKSRATSMRASGSRPTTGTASSACAATSPDPPWVARASRSRTTAPSSST